MHHVLLGVAYGCRHWLSLILLLLTDRVVLKLWLVVWLDIAAIVWEVAIRSGGLIYVSGNLLPTATVAHSHLVLLLLADGRLVLQRLVVDRIRVLLLVSKPLTILEAELFAEWLVLLPLQFLFGFNHLLHVVGNRSCRHVWLVHHFLLRGFVGGGWLRVLRVRHNPAGLLRHLHLLLLLQILLRGLLLESLRLLWLSDLPVLLQLSLTIYDYSTNILCCGPHQIHYVTTLYLLLLLLVKDVSRPGDLRLFILDAPSLFSYPHLVLFGLIRTHLTSLLNLPRWGRPVPRSRSWWCCHCCTRIAPQEV